MHKKLILATAVSMALAACGDGNNGNLSAEGPTASPAADGTAPGTTLMEAEVIAPQAEAGAETAGVSPVAPSLPYISGGLLHGMLFHRTLGAQNEPEVLSYRGRVTPTPVNGIAHMAFAYQETHSRNMVPALQQLFGATAMHNQETGGVTAGVAPGTTTTTFTKEAQQLPILFLLTGLSPVPETVTSYTLSPLVVAKLIVGNAPPDSPVSAGGPVESSTNVFRAAPEDDAKRTINLTDRMPINAYVFQWKYVVPDSAPAGAAGPAGAHASPEQTTFQTLPGQSVIPPGQPGGPPIPPAVPNSTTPNQTPFPNQPGLPQNPPNPGPVNTTPSTDYKVQLYILSEPENPQQIAVCWYVFLRQIDRQSCTLWRYETPSEPGGPIRQVQYAGQRIVDFTKDPANPWIYISTPGLSPQPPAPQQLSQTPTDPPLPLDNGDSLLR